MKKILTLFIALLMLVSVSACGKDPGDSDAAKPADSAAESQTAGDGSENGAQNGGSAEGARLTGKLEVVDSGDGDPSVLRGVRISGNAAGDAEFNGKEPSLTDVRCIFELNEWVEFYPDADAEYGLRVWVLEHRDDAEYYNDCAFSDLMPGFASYCDLHYPVDADDPDGWYWGSFYLNSEDCEAGFTTRASSLRKPRPSLKRSCTSEVRYV